MNKPINRTTVQYAENKYRTYCFQAPIFYKTSEGTYEEIDHTFQDTTSNIGEISLMNKGVLSVGKRKGNNPHKVVGIRPDNNQHEGTQQLEFSLVNVELDGISQEFNVEDDLEIKLKASKVFQLIKLNKSFQSCKIEFDIYAKNLELQNTKYETDTTLYDYSFKITNIGDNNGSTTLGMYNSYNVENSDIPSLDCYVGKITDEYITTGEYSISEEFGDDDLSDYTLEQMYIGGSSVYYKDAIIFAVKPQNIDNFESIITSHICDIYGYEIFNDGGKGVYFTKNNKKIGGFYSNDNTFFAFFNTQPIPDKIKTLFKRKTFQETSYVDFTVSEFEEAIKSRFNKDLKITVNSDNYKPFESNCFEFKINKHSMVIGTPIAFNENYENLYYSTDHTLTMNEDGSYRYTKLLTPKQSLLLNTAQYLDTALAIDQVEDSIPFYQVSTSNTSQLPNPRTQANLTIIRDATSGTAANQGEGGIFNEDFITTAVGRSFSATSTTTGGSQNSPGVTTYTKTWRFTQSNFHFDTSGVTDTVTAVSLRFRGTGVCTDLIDGVRKVNIIALKSSITGTSTSASDRTDEFNNMVGHTSGWDDTDVTQYSSKTGITADVNASYNSTSPENTFITLNSTARTDVTNDNEFTVGLYDHDIFYENPTLTSLTTTKQNYYSMNQVDALTTAYRPYLEYSTDVFVPSANDSVFFGTNF